MRASCLHASHNSLRPPPGLVTPDAQLSLHFSFPSFFFFPLCVILSLSLLLPLFFSPPRQEVGPPRPPLPKSYQPLETSQTFPPSIPPLPINSNAWLHSIGPHASLHQESYKDEEEYHSRKVPQRRDCTELGQTFNSHENATMSCVHVHTCVLIITDPNHDPQPTLARNGHSLSFNFHSTSLFTFNQNLYLVLFAFVMYYSLSFYLKPNTVALN